MKQYAHNQYKSINQCFCENRLEEAIFIEEVTNKRAQPGTYYHENDKMLAVSFLTNFSENILVEITTT